MKTLQPGINAYSRPKVSPTSQLRWVSWETNLWNLCYGRLYMDNEWHWV